MTTLSLSLSDDPFIHQWQACPPFPPGFFAVVYITSWHFTYFFFSIYSLPALCSAYFCFPRTYNNASCREGARKVLLNDCECTNLLLFQMTALQVVKNSLCVLYWVLFSLGKIFSVPSISFQRCWRINLTIMNKMSFIQSTNNWALPMYYTCLHTTPTVE